MQKQIVPQTRFLEEEEEENEVSAFKLDWTDAPEKKTVSEAPTSFVSSKESYPSQTRINKNDFTEIALLEPGDHIGWDRDYPITHHAIVEKIDIDMKQILVVHNNKNGVVEEWIKPASENGVLIRFDYPTYITQANPNQLVLKKAKSLIDKKEYHLLENNCEHFATWCKTGKARSAQVERRKTEAQVTAVCSTITAAGKQGLSAIEKISEFLSETSSVVGKVARVGEKIAPLGGIFAPVGGIVTPLGGIVAPVGGVVASMGGQMNSIQSIMPMTMGAPWVDESRLRMTNDIVNSILKRPHVAIKAEAKKATSKISKRVGIGLTVAFETIHCGYDIYQYYKQNGGILNSQFIRNSLQRVSEGVFSTALCVAGNCLGEKVGTALGQKIGTTIGAAVGSVIPFGGSIVGGFIGSAIGGIAGACVGKALGATVGRFLTNLFW